jgi:arsenic resistance protein ArsH
MNVLLFNGCSDTRPETTGRKLSAYLHNLLAEGGHTVTQINVSDAHIPFFELRQPNPPAEVEAVVSAFTRSDLQIWLTPLYHGGMTGAMKNCLDWLELTSRREKPYLTDKVVGLVCWADGGQAMQGINAMDAVAKALRAWVIPYTVPLVKSQLYTDAHRRELSVEHTRKLDRLVTLLGNAAQAFAITS